MLSFDQRLPFPDLIYCGRFKFREVPDAPCKTPVSTPTVALFRLDWKEHDLQARPKEGHIDLVPPHWAAWLDGCRFSLDDVYQSEIHRHCRAALLDWQLDAPFDRRIGEILQQPAVSHVEVAFRLLADCLWDTDKMDWERGHPRKVFLSAALLRFWDGKVGEVNCARLDDLRALPGCLVKVRGEYATGSAIEEALVLSFLRDVEARMEAQRASSKECYGKERNPVTIEEMEAILRDEGRAPDPGQPARVAAIETAGRIEGLLHADGPGSAQGG
jgi:hypothetical protein